jgi:hypothetical protein
MPHLDAETVAAFSAQALNSAERSQVFEHLADCEACREWIAVNAQLHAPKSTLPIRAPLAAMAAACAVVALWLASPPSAGDITIALRRHTEFSLLNWQEPNSNSLPAAWKQIKLAPYPTPHPPANQVSIKTTVGEKWITVDGLFEPVQDFEHW